MKILMAHNYYQQRGGEDAVFEAERDLLRARGHEVLELTFHNEAIDSRAAALSAGAKGFYNPQAARQTRRIIRDERPDVMHVHNWFPLASPSIFSAAHGEGVPVVATLHNFRLICPKAQLFREGRPCEACVKQPLALSGILHGCYRDSRLQSAAVAGINAWHGVIGTWQHHVDAFIALTDFARQKLLSGAMGLTPSQVVVKPNFCGDPGDNDAPREDFFLFVGRLSPEKGIETLLQAFAQTGLPLRLVGTGPLSARAAQAAAQFPNIVYEGFLPPADVRQRMMRARALTFPSLWYEGFPLTLVEALACGAPALVSQMGGLPEIVAHEAQGLLIPPGDADALADATLRIAADAGLRQRLSHNARQKYLNQYTAEVTYEHLRGIYARVCDARRDRRLQFADETPQTSPAGR